MTEKFINTRISWRQLQLDVQVNNRGLIVIETFLYFTPYSLCRTRIGFGIRHAFDSFGFEDSIVIWRTYFLSVMTSRRGMFSVKVGPIETESVNARCWRECCGNQWI